MPHTYACKDFPGMETCPGSFTAATEAELWKHIELHARLAHDENPDAWSPDDKAQVKAAVRAVP